MSRISQLNDLQEIDREILTREASLLEVEARTGESEEIAEARALLAEMRARRDQLGRTQRDAEGQAEDFQAKIAGFEAKLYGGEVTNPKELVVLQEEVSLLNQAKTKVDDSLLETLEQIDGLQGDIQAQESRLAEMEQAWVQEQERLTTEQDKLNVELEQYRTRRNVFASRIEPKDLSLYQTLLLAKGGRAVAKVERNACQGCRITIAMNQLHRARSGQEVVQCPSCQRILYAT